MRVCLGGTFDHLHPGHVALIAKAFEVGTEVFIGVTSDRLARRGRRRQVKPFAARKRAVMALLRRNGWSGTVSEIDHPFGASVEKKYQGIVVSAETLPRVIEINRERRRRGYRFLKAFVIPFFYARDGLRISATRIAKKEIDARGRRLRPVSVAVGSTNRLKVLAVRDAFEAAFPGLRFRVRGHRVSSGVPEQPLDEDTLTGAENRARRAFKAAKDADYAVGVEAGLLADARLGRRLDVQHVVIVDKHGGVTASHGGGFYYPRHVEQRIVRGKTVSEVLGGLAKRPRLGSTIGAVGFLSRGAIDRRELTRHAVLLALVPRIRRDLYQE